MEAQDSKENRDIDDNNKDNNDEDDNNDEEEDEDKGLYTIAVDTHVFWEPKEVFFGKQGKMYF